MKRIGFITIFLVYLLLSTSKVYAQLSTINPDDRIRVIGTKYFYKPVIGKFEKLYSDSLFIKINAKTMVIPIQHLQKIEISKEQKRNTIMGALIGSVSGGLVLGLVTYNAEQNCEGFGCVGQPGFKGGFVAGVLLGGGIGALIGRSIRSDVWKEISIKQK